MENVVRRAGEVAGPACTITGAPVIVAAEILVGRDVDHPRLRAERDRRPVLAAPERRAEFRRLAGAGLVGRIDVGPSGLRIEALEHVLLHVRLAFDELDRAVRALEKPQIAVARDVDQPLDRSAVALVVDENRRRHLVPVPRIVRVVLVSGP